MNKRGFTLIEILVSMVLVALILLSLSNLFVAGRKYVRYSRTKMTGGELGKVFLDPLQMDVRQDTWGSNALNTDTTYCDSDLTHVQNPDCPSDRTIDNVEYSAKYEISTHPDNANIRKAVTTITWPKE